MRVIILNIIVVILCLTSLFRPVVGILGYLWFGLMRPDALAWAAYGSVPQSLLIAVCTITGSVRFANRIGLVLLNPMTAGVLILQIPIFLSVVGALDPTLSYAPYWLYVRVIAMSMFIPLLITAKDHVRYMILVIAGSLGFLGVKFGLYGVINGGVRFASGYGGFLSDNNAIALALAMGFPLCIYGRELTTSKWARLGLMLAAMFTMAAVIMTYSRGGALSLAAAILYVLLQARRKWVAVLLVLIPLAYFLMLVGDSYFDRIETLKNPESEGSSYARMQYAKNAVEIAKDYPALGVGFGTLNQMAIQYRYVQFVGGAQVIHNTYLQMLTDSGIAAFGIYVITLFGTITYLIRAIRRAKREYPDWAAVPQALCGALITWSIGSAFLSKVDFDLMYILVAAAGCWYNFERRSRAELVEPDETETMEHEGIVAA